MADVHGQEQSWSGYGVGTDRDSFLEKIEEVLPEIGAAEAAEAVTCTLLGRLSGGTAERLMDQLPPDIRELLDRCPRRTSPNAPKQDVDDFYLQVAEHLLVDPDDVRRILSAVFRALHTQITEAEAERITRELPSRISSTWEAARHNAPAPH